MSKEKLSIKMSASDRLKFTQIRLDKLMLDSVGMELDIRFYNEITIPFYQKEVIKAKKDQKKFFEQKIENAKADMRGLDSTLAMNGLALELLQREVKELKAKLVEVGDRS